MPELPADVSSDKPPATCPALCRPFYFAAVMLKELPTEKRRPWEFPRRDSSVFHTFSPAPAVDVRAVLALKSKRAVRTTKKILKKWTLKNPLAEGRGEGQPRQIRPALSQTPAEFLSPRPLGQV